MNILDIFRYLRNYITISVSGGFIERFINLCGRENVYLWDTAYRDGGFTAKIYCRDFKRLPGIRRKSGVKIKTVKKYGLHFFVRENRKRKILAAGIVASLLLMLVMNNFVWSIDVTGAKEVGKKEIAEILEESGLKYGTFAPSFDESKAGRDAVNLSDGKILWLAINIKGSKATVEVRDYISPEEEAEDKAPCNIVADFDGIILSSYVHRGVQIAHSGAAVKKGDLLISGISENENGAEYFSADGEITAMHKQSLEISFPDKTEVHLFNELKHCYIVKLFGINIPLYIKSADDIGELSYTEYLSFDGNVIPIGFQKNITAKNKTELQSGFTLLEKIDLFTEAEYERFKNTCITDTDYFFKTKNNTLNITGIYNCIDFMGVKSILLKEN